MKFLSLLAVATLALSVTVDAGRLIERKNAKVIPGQYIVMLKQNLTEPNRFADKIKEISHRNRKNILAHGGRRKYPKITHQYENLNGYAIEDGDEDLEELLNQEDVDYIEQDSEFTIAASQSNPPSWGLPRIILRSPPTGSKTPFTYPDQAGSGITAYVLDTGIYTEHSDFEGRARAGANAVNGTPNTDENGHGTHVAGTIGGKTFGVAKKVKLVSVKVLNSSGGGQVSNIVAGMDWVIKDAPGKRAIVNMSIVGGSSQVIEDAVGRLAAANLPVFVAAGNDPQKDACEGSLSGHYQVYSVTASDKNDALAIFSSYGPCVDMIAPGVDIISAFNMGTGSSLITSGTSQAAPHVAGVAAVYMSMDKNLKTPTQVYTKLTQTCTKNKITGNLRGTPNRFLYLAQS
ncbi:subtilisin-like serine protease [Actinomortierella ambigua]|nr:subtilisin-like serine protease [Actinomortierella ambigua]